MLYSVESESYIETIPHQDDFRAWRRRLTDEEYGAVVTELRSRLGAGEVHTSSWIPGSDWSDTPFQVIYDKACRQDHEAAAKFFGLILWAVLLDDERVWAFGRYERDGIPIEGLTYFIVEPD